MKLAPLTNYELEFIRWRIWEPLRRNQHYRNEYFKLKKNHFLELEAVSDFCRKWKLPYHLHPDTKFSELHKLGSAIVNPFHEHYKPVFDHAAFVDVWNWIIDQKYLKVWIDLEASRNQIEKALGKELDEWWSDKWINFYRGKRKRKLKEKIVFLVDILENFLEIHINLEAPRSKIENEIKTILDSHLSVWRRHKKRINRLHPNSWTLCFKVYDLAQQNCPFPQIALKLNIKTDTVYKQFKRAWQSIYPDTEYPSKRKRKKYIAKEALKKTCITCTERKCEETGKLCKEMEAYVSQDEISSGGVTDFEDIADRSEFVKWDIDPLLDLIDKSRNK